MIVVSLVDRSSALICQVVKASSGIADVPQLAGRKVLTVKGGTQEENVRKAVPTVDVVTFETTQQAFQALQQGKGAGYVNDEATLVNDMAKLGPARKDYRILPTNLSTEPPESYSSALVLPTQLQDTGIATSSLFIASRQTISSVAPAAAIKWPIMLLVLETGIL